jgi:GAF domain-containing protein
MRDITTCLTMMQGTAHRLSGALSEPEVIQVLLEQAMLVFEARGALVRLLSPDGQELVLGGSSGLSDAYLSKGPVWLSNSGVDRHVIAGEAIVIDDISYEAGFQYPAAAAAEGLQGAIAVPLRVRDNVIGLLRIYLQEVDQLGDEELRLASCLADLGALALEKVRLHQSLYRIAEVLNSSLDLQDMLRKMLDTVVHEMGLRAASIRLLDAKGQGLVLAAASGLSDHYLAKGPVLVGHSPVDQRVLDGESVVLHDVEMEPGFEYPREAVQEGIRSVLVVPLKLQDRTQGVMRVYSARPRHFSNVGITFLTSVAGLVALAIERAELHAVLREQYEDLKLDVAEWHRFLALG